MKKTCILQTIVWIINPAGGVGKTTIAQCMQALSHMIGIDMHLASQDRGNQALKHAFPETHLIAPDALAPDAFRVVSRVENREIFVIDVGANPSGPDYDPLPFALALQAEVSQRGGKMIGVVPVTPLKINGCASALSTVRSLQNEGIETHLVKNHQDASRRFGELELPEGVPISELKYLPSGLMSLVRDHVGSIADLCRNPDPDFTLAGGHIEQWLVDAARDPHGVASGCAAWKGRSHDQAKLYRLASHPSALREGRPIYRNGAGCLGKGTRRDRHKGRWCTICITRGFRAGASKSQFGDDSPRRTCHGNIRLKAWKLSRGGRGSPGEFGQARLST